MLRDGASLTNILPLLLNKDIFSDSELFYNLVNLYGGEDDDVPLDYSTFPKMNKNDMVLMVTRPSITGYIGYNYRELEHSGSSFEEMLNTFLCTYFKSCKKEFIITSEYLRGIIEKNGQDTSYRGAAFYGKNLPYLYGLGDTDDTHALKRKPFKLEDDRTTLGYILHFPCIDFSKLPVSKQNYNENAINAVNKLKVRFLLIFGMSGTSGLLLGHLLKRNIGLNSVFNSMIDNNEARFIICRYPIYISNQKRFFTLPSLDPEEKIIEINVKL